VVRKAISKNPFYQFNNLKKYFPQLRSVSEFIAGSNYLGSARFKVAGIDKELRHLSVQEQLELCLTILESIANGWRKT
jgi:type III restriction enzyme